MNDLIISPEDRLRVLEDVHITALLDGSSSMTRFADKTRASANAYIAELQSGAPVDLSMARFADSVNWIVTDTPSDAVLPLTRDTYFASGGTVLYDAIGDAIAQIEAKDVPPVHPVIVVFTDGKDARSSRYTAEQLKEMIALRRNLGWRFIAFVIGHQAQEAVEQAGFLPADTAPYSGDTTDTAFKQLAASTTRLASAVLMKALPPATFLA